MLVALAVVAGCEHPNATNALYEALQNGKPMGDIEQEETRNTSWQLLFCYSTSQAKQILT